jgi:hypothetical protein
MHPWLRYDRSNPKAQMDKAKTALIGTWQSDPDDPSGNQEYGRVTLKFDTEGTLLYTVHEHDKDQIVRLTYSVDEQFIVTSQPSQPRTKKLDTNLLPESCCLPSPAKHRDTCAQSDNTNPGARPSKRQARLCPLASTRPEARSERLRCTYPTYSIREQKKGRPEKSGRPLDLIPATTYVPTQLPVQYHRPCEA